MMRALLCCSIFLALACGGKEVLPQKPQLLLDRDSVGFGLDFGSGTFIGTQPQESLQLENGGLDPLHITSVARTGDSAFTVDGPPETVVKGKDRTFLRILFKPTQARDYTATVTIESDAENAPHKEVKLTGKGVSPRTDAGP